MSDCTKNNCDLCPKACSPVENAGLDKFLAEVRDGWSKPYERERQPIALTVDVSLEAQPVATEAPIFMSPEAQRRLFICLIAARNLAIKEKAGKLYANELNLLRRLSEFIDKFPKHAIQGAAIEIDQMEAIQGPLQLGSKGTQEVLDIITAAPEAVLTQ